MFDMSESYWEVDTSCYNEPIVKPNRITGEGRMKIRGANKLGDKKKKQHRKMAKKSRRTNRR